MTRFGVALGIAGTVLVAFLLVAIYVLDPLGFISVPLGELYAAPDHQPMYALAIGWSLIASALIWGAAVLEGRRAKRQDTSATKRAGLRASGSLALLGGVCVSSFIPGMPIGLGFILDAENGGYFSGDGGGLLSGGWVTGFVACVLGLLGLLFVRLANARQDSRQALVG